MLILDRPTHVGSTDRQTQCNFRVRVLPDGPMVELPFGKTTIGSSPRCTIRIQQPGVQPLHCLLLREQDGVSARRWSGETQLNGHTLDESILEEGDMLRVAGVELELVPAEAAKRPQPMNGAAVVSPSVESRATTDQSMAGPNVARSRTQQMLAVLRRRRDAQRESNERITGLESQLAIAGRERGDLATRLQSALSELAAVRGRAAEQQGIAAKSDELLSQNEHLGREVNTLIQRIDQLTTEQTIAANKHRALIDEKESLVAEGQRLGSEIESLCQQLQDSENRCRELGEQCRVESQTSVSLRAECETWAAKESSLRQEVARLQQELAQKDTRASDLATELTNACRERDDARTAAESLRTDIELRAGEEANLHEEIRRLQQEVASGQSRIGELGCQVESLSGERDEARSQCESVRRECQSIAGSEASLRDSVARLEQELATRNAERDDLTHRLGVIGAEQAQKAEQYSQLAAECDRLRHEAARATQLEQQIRETIADRENTSSELYRALLQLAEMQERDDQHMALAAAHEAVNAELKKSIEEIAALQVQIDRLAVERATVEEAQQALTEKTAELVATKQLVDCENKALLDQLESLQQQLLAAEQRAAETATRLEAANEWRSRCEQAEQTSKQWSDAADQLQRQLAESKRSAEESASALAARDATIARLNETLEQVKAESHHARQGNNEAIEKLAARDQQIAEQSQQLAASSDALRVLEQQLATAETVKVRLEEHQEAWQREADASAAKIAALSQLTEELRSELLGAKAVAENARHSQLATSAAIVELAAASRAISEPLESEFESTSENDALATPVSRDESPWATRFDSVADEPEVEEGGVESMHSVDPDSQGDEYESEPVTEHSLETTANLVDELRTSLEDESPANDWKASPPAVQEKTIDEPLPTRESNATSTFDTPVCPAASVSQPTSFIERYAHMFAEENAADGTLLSGASSAPRSEEAPPNAPRPSALAAVCDSAKTTNTEADEESIEAYMAKLLQRVRGESNPASIAEAATTPAEPVMPISAPAGFMPSALQSDEATAPLGDELTRRRPPSPAPQTDLEALRELANESARRAISRHHLRKHRSNARTKAIISTLAAATSVWLMLNSTHWQSLPFITACVVLGVAAYWAYQTVRSLLVTWKVGAAEEAHADIEQLASQHRSPLPIDVEGQRNWSAPPMVVDDAIGEQDDSSNPAAEN